MSSELKSQHDEGVVKARNLLKRINKEKYEREKRRQMIMRKHQQEEEEHLKEEERLK